MIAAPFASDAALDKAIGVLVGERGWRVVSRWEYGARLRRNWTSGEVLNVPILLALLVAGILPGIVYLLACPPRKTERGEVFLSIVASDGEETIIEFAGGPWRRLKRAAEAVAQSLWLFDARPLYR